MPRQNDRSSLWRDGCIDRVWLPATRKADTATLVDAHLIATRGGVLLSFLHPLKPRHVDLKSGYPFWAVNSGLMHAFPPLESDLRCDVVVVGGGISGALIADELVRHGHDVAVIEQRDIGWGSTAASTAMLQYEIDTSMTDLVKRYGEAAAALSYRACGDAIAALAKIANDVGGVGFARNASLYFASRRRDLDGMQAELVLRRRHGFEIEWLQSAELDERYGLQAPGAMLSALGARVDPYRLTYRLLARLQKAGAQVFDRTRIERIESSQRSVILRTADGFTVRAKHVVMAAGYANQVWLKHKVARNHSTYAFVTDPVGVDSHPALAKTLIWESARPYLYMRRTADQRWMVGGEDDSIDLPARRDARVDSKARRLVSKVRKAFPELSLDPAFAWAGTFAETKDGLPYFGPHPQYGPRVLFAMAYGGNGITYAMIGAGLLRARIERRSHRLATLFSFDRL